MPKLRIQILNNTAALCRKLFNKIGDASGCHQDPDKSFVIKGYIFPLCARCTGVSLGQITALVMGIFGKKISPILSIGLMAVMGADWSVQFLGIKQSTNIRRLITGIMGGFGIISLYFAAFRWIFKVIAGCKQG